MNLTKSDKIILSNLEYNPRITDKKLGELCHLSKDSIRYRIKRLESAHIIKKYSCFIDYTKLAYQTYKIYLKVTLTHEEKTFFKKYLRSIKNTFAFAESKGNWDFAICFFSKTHKEFHEIENNVLSKIKGKVRDKRFCSLFDATMFDKQILDLKSDSSKIIAWETPENNLLDESDKKIIKALFNNSRSPLIEIARETRLNVDTVRSRMKKLFDKKIISTLMTVIDYDKLNYTHYKLLISLKEHSNEIENNLASHFKEDSVIINFTKSIGSWAFEVEYLVEDYSELENSLSNIQDKFSNEIRDLEYSAYTNEEMFAANKFLFE